jgi:hypothetical protein
MSGSKTDKNSDLYSDEEIARRRDELAKRMLNMPPRPLKPKLKGGTKANPPKKRRVVKEGKVNRGTHVPEYFLG